MAQLEGWSLLPGDWEAVGLALQGTAWHVTLLRPLNQDDVPKMPGIYMLVTELERWSRQRNMPTGIANVLYVGRSDNLHRRFLEHSRQHSANPLIKRCRDIFGNLRYFYTQAPKNAGDVGDWLGRAETVLINALSPPGNRNVPKGFPVMAHVGEAQSLS